MDLAQVADDLYGLAPAEFTGARDERARQARAAGEKDLADAIKKLRRPTVSAWLVNRLVREVADQVDGLLDLGESLREAQQTLAGDQLRRLSAQRRPMIHALAQAAKRLAAEAGRPVSDPVEREVEATLEAALADPAAADALRSGRLTAALVYAGFGGVDVTDAVAVPAASSPRAGRRSADGSRQRSAAPPHQVARDRRKTGPVAREGAKAEAKPQEGRKAGAEPEGEAAAAEAREANAAARERRDAQATARERRDAQATARERREAEAAARERREAEAAARDLRDAEAAAQDAAENLGHAARHVTGVRDARKAAEQRIEELEQQLQEAQAHEAEVFRALRDAERSRDTAARLADTAQRYLERVRARTQASPKDSAQRPPL